MLHTISPSLHDRTHQRCFIFNDISNHLHPLSDTHMVPLYNPFPLPFFFISRRSIPVVAIFLCPRSCIWDSWSINEHVCTWMPLCCHSRMMSQLRRMRINRCDTSCQCTINTLLIHFVNFNYIPLLTQPSITSNQSHSPSNPSSPLSFLSRLLSALCSSLPPT